MVGCLQTNAEINKEYGRVLVDNVQQKTDFFKKLYAMYVPQLMASMRTKAKKRRLGLDTQEVDDIVSIVMIKIFFKLETYKIHTSFTKFVEIACIRALYKASKAKKKGRDFHIELAIQEKKTSFSDDEVLENKRNMVPIHFKSLEEVYDGFNNKNKKLCDAYCNHSKLEEPKKMFLLWYVLAFGDAKVEELVPMTKYTESTIKTYKSKVKKELERLGATILKDIGEDEFSIKDLHVVIIENQNTED